MKVSPTTILLVVLIATLLLHSLSHPCDYNKMCNKEGRSKISIVCWNSRGLVTSLPYLHSLLESNDIIALSEHWLHSNKLNILTEMSSDFNVVARSSKYSDASSFGYRRGQGGVALLWRKTIGGVSPITSLINDRICGIRVQGEFGRVVNIFSVYLPAPGSADDLSVVLDELSVALEQVDEGSISIVCGDYNGDVGHLGGPKSTRRPTVQGRKIMNFFNEFSLYPCNLDASAKGPLNTFRGGIGSSTIDYLALPLCMRDNVVSCEVLTDPILNTSDHDAVQVSIGLDGLNMKYSSPVATPSIKWNKISNENMSAVYTTPVEEFCVELLKSTDFENLGDDELDLVIDNITCKLVQTSNNLPKTRFKQHVRPYWSGVLSDLKRVKVHAYRIWTQDGRPRDPSSQSWVSHKKAKRDFRRELKKVQREYDQKQIQDIVENAECDKNKFWRLIKNARQQKQSSSIAIKNRQGKVVQEISEVVEAWRDHLSYLCKKKMDPKYDSAHYDMVSECVREWASDRDSDIFLEEPLSQLEVGKAIKKLNKGKSSGCDSLSAEHLQNGGPNLIQVLTKVFRRVVKSEYVPVNFRLGTQIPLYKGKNTCTLDLNNYRGITLLTSLNKVFEILLWQRMKDWWVREQVISPLQGACCTGKSCIHSALILQESIAVGLGTGKRVLVTYLDVSKAFDGVWIDGLFYQLRRAGIDGKVWRLLYSTYQDFKCKVRIAGTYSDWYTMECGIHQGGFLSLLKYVAFIDPLLRDLETSDLGCRVVGVPTNPVGYADDLASASVSRTGTDATLGVVGEHAKKWRYTYNAKKSAVLVFGETRREHERGRKFRNFVLDGEKVPERIEYDHLGIKNCLFQNTMPRTEDRISRGRRAFNAATILGIHKKGINIKTCSIIFWSIIVPIVTYGSELWVLTSSEIEELRKFQRYVGRRCQRFPKRSPNFSAYTSMGWMSLDRVVQVKKLLFLRTIMVMDDDDRCKMIMMSRANEFCENLEVKKRNEYGSPIFDILSTSIQVDLFDTCMRMIRMGCMYSKAEWKKLVWEKVWCQEDEDCLRMYKQPSQNHLLFEITGKPYYLVWWILGDLYPSRMRMCEIMASLVCEAGLLRSTDYRLKKQSHSTRICDKCDLGILENANHIIMQCPFYTDERRELFYAIKRIHSEVANRVINDPLQYYNVIMGKHPEYASFEDMLVIWLISGTAISNIYTRAIEGR